MNFTEWIRRLKAAEPWIEEGYSYKGVSWKGTVPVDEVKKQIDARARHYSIDEKDTPIRSINISGTRILDIDLNKGWEITDIIFDNARPANEIDYLVVRFEKKKESR